MSLTSRFGQLFNIVDTRAKLGVFVAPYVCFVEFNDTVRRSGNYSKGINKSTSCRKVAHNLRPFLRLGGRLSGSIGLVFGCEQEIVIDFYVI